MSKIIVFGATGKTGLEIVRQSLAKNHEVVALVRQPDKLKIKHPRLEIKSVDIFDRKSIENALPPNAAAIVSAIGATKIRQPTTVYSESAKNIIAAMNAKKLRRFICIASSGYVDDPKQTFLVRFLQKKILRKIFRYVYEDTMKMEKIVGESDLDWTMIRPPRLTDGKHTENYRVRKTLVPRGMKISRADLADYIVKNLENTQTFRTIFGVAY